MNQERTRDVLIDAEAARRLLHQVAAHPSRVQLSADEAHAMASLLATLIEQTAAERAAREKAEGERDELQQANTEGSKSEQQLIATEQAVRRLVDAQPDEATEEAVASMIEAQEDDYKSEKKKRESAEAEASRLRAEVESLKEQLAAALVAATPAEDKVSVDDLEGHDRLAAALSPDEGAVPE